jgi:phosphoesterase RecJ-like protein
MSGELAGLMRDRPRWTLLIHEKPDGDAAGCGAALASLGGRLGKEVLWTGPDPIPSRYDFLPLAGKYRPADRVPGGNEPGTLFLVLDTSEAKRTSGPLPDPESGSLVRIDHHPGGEVFGSLDRVDPGASATAELVFSLFEEGGWVPDRGEATALYVALVSDNGNFRFSSTSPASHRIAARLLEAGADPMEIDRRLNDTMTPGGLRLWGRALSRIEIFPGGGVLSWVGDSDFGETLSDPADTEGLVNMLLRIGEARLVLLCTGADGQVRCSVRTRGERSAREFARRHGGGGHERAAGFSLSLPLEEALEKLRRALVEP